MWFEKYFGKLSLRTTPDGREMTGYTGDKNECKQYKRNCQQDGERRNCSLGGSGKSTKYELGENSAIAVSVLLNYIIEPNIRMPKNPKEKTTSI